MDREITSLKNLVLEEFQETGLRFSFTIQASEFAPYLRAELLSAGVEQDETPELVTPVRGRMELTLSGKHLVVKGVFAVKINMTCARCLSNFTARLGDKIDEVVEIGDSQGASSSENPDYFIKVINGRIDLTPLLAELFWLTWPLKALCQEDCKGLCAHCGANLNEGSCSCAALAETKH
ncbi:MAG: DUF177 domain-containing protein [Deltaproteobacteria bacterium]|jgi:uncharacterized metal-binding protein YceD (DUF177 family)|nr:DUF177 domain-containing protein [Deltaproteobacteria bacterium]